MGPTETNPNGAMAIWALLTKPAATALVRYRKTGTHEKCAGDDDDDNDDDDDDEHEDAKRQLLRKDRKFEEGGQEHRGVLGLDKEEKEKKKKQRPEPNKKKKEKGRKIWKS